METSPADDIIVRIDAQIGDDLLGQSEASELRLAPSLRGVDLASTGGILLAVTGIAADVVTLVLAREHIANFARRFVAALQSRSTRAQGDRLTVSLTRGSTRMTLELEADAPVKLADALRALAELTDPD